MACTTQVDPRLITSRNACSAEGLTDEGGNRLHSDAYTENFLKGALQLVQPQGAQSYIRMNHTAHVGSGLTHVGPDG